MLMIAYRGTNSLVSLFLFDYIIYFDAFFHHYFQEGNNCESDVYRYYQHEFVPARPRHYLSDNDLPDGRSKTPASIDDPCHCRLRSLARLQDLVLSDVSRAGCRNDVVEATDYESEDQHQK